MAEQTLVGAITSTLDQALARDPDVILLGEDIGLNGGVFRATDGLQATHGKDRVVDTPLDESGIMGTAIGLAIAGMKSIPEIQFEGFLGPAYDQLVNHAARMRTRTRSAVTVPMTVRVPVGGGIHAPELHSDSPEVIYAHSPGVKVVMPCTPYDAKGLLNSAIKDPDPVIFFEPKRVYRTFKEDVPDDYYEIPIGEAKVVSEGEDLTIVTWGASVFQALEAIDNLPEDVSVELIDLRSIYPFDMDTVAESVSKTGRCVIVHEAPLTGGMGAEIAARVMEECFLHLEAPVQRVTGFDTIMPYYKLENEYLPESPRILKGITECLAY
ncbi:MAG: alpha-ketoacid dehydrogenase subunit beta [Phycisphaerales bacterium]|nr:alpha-ketoacid dehydrogenase subunit beta [Phycisphaerales bacterium]